MTVRPIRTEADYEAALARYEAFFDDEPELGSAAGDEFELLGLVLARYEEEHFPLTPSDPVEAVRFTMDRRGLTQADLGRVLGSRSRASEVLAGRRSLTLENMRALVRDWGVPAASFLGEAAPRSAA